jgi:hypothetical protein
MATTVLAWIGAAAGSILLLVLLVPFRVRARGELSDVALAGTVEVRWLFGALGLRWSSQEPSGLLLLGRRVAGWGRSDRPERETEPRGKRGLRWALGNRAALSRVIGRALSALRLRCELSGRLGVGDPADTAFLSSAVAQLERLPAVRLRLSWEWIEEVIELEGRVAARLWLGQLIAVMLPLLLDGEVRRLVRAPA